MPETVSLITGASRGIGRATALALAAAGSRVALGGRDEAALAETSKLVTGAGGEALICPLDVTSDSSVKKCVAAVIEHWGRLDHLINNAGMTRDGLLLRARSDDWQAVVDTNLGGVFRTSRAVLPTMVRARWGRIINMASVIGETGNPGQTVYAPARQVSSVSPSPWPGRSPAAPSR